MLAARNTLDEPLTAALLAYWQSLHDRPEIRVVIVRYFAVAGLAVHSAAKSA